MEKEKSSTLRSGYTTGSCAAAAACAAAEYLFAGIRLSCVLLRLPAGKKIMIPVEILCGNAGHIVSCGVRKDSGDDPDVTDGAVVYADLCRSAHAGISIDGGEGIGRVTKPGLDQPVGAAAINSTPRRMIRDQVAESALRHGVSLDECGVDVTIRIPGGEELARKTFNPKLGILGGLSVLGTTGIVEPMSEPAILATIRAELSVRSAEGYSSCVAAPGNYGMNFLQKRFGMPADLPVTASNFIRDTVCMAGETGFHRMLLAGHAGKLVKVAGGIPNTHSRYGDGRMEILQELAEYAAADRERYRPTEQAGIQDEAGCLSGNRDKAGSSGVPDLSHCVTTDEALRILDEAGLADAVMREAVERIRRVCLGWLDTDYMRNGTGYAGDKPHGCPEGERNRRPAMEVEVCMFTFSGKDAMTDGAEELIYSIMSEWKKGAEVFENEHL